MVDRKDMAGSFLWRGQRWEIDGQELLDRANRIIDDGPPEEALRYKSWAVDVGGRPMSVKWLFGLATGADHADFTSQTARRALGQIGIRPYPVGSGGEAMDTSRPSGRDETRALRAEFFREVEALLPDKLPAQARHAETEAIRNLLKVRYPEFTGMHYELRLARTQDEIAIHFKSSRAACLDRLSVFRPAVDQLSAAVGHRVVAEPWGTYWARVAIGVDKVPRTAEHAEAHCDLLARFIDVTFDLVRQAYIKRPSGRGAKKNKDTPRREDAQAHDILDENLARIRRFLRGRLPRPSDEALCDWVHFCYVFQLYHEADQLFQRVDRTAVNDWLYQRTRRTAEVCRMRGHRGGSHGR